MEIDIPEEGYIYGILLGGRKHSKLMMVPQNVNQILISDFNENAIYCRDRISEPEPFEKEMGDVYTKYEVEFLTKDNYRIGLWYIGFGRHSKKLAGEALSLMKEEWELKHILYALALEGKNDVQYH